MPEIKNTFLKSKMNKDLDARLLPNGEYRDAQNINVSRSEGSDVGALENVLGNTLLTDIKSSIESLESSKNDKIYFSTTGDFKLEGLEIIGYYIDENNNKMFLFITDYSDSSNDQLSSFAPSDVTTILSSPVVPPNNQFEAKGAACYIVEYNTLTNKSTVLVGGNFLNFSKTHPIINVNLLEDLLFWTDDRNQPRKINIKKASLDSPSGNGSWESWIPSLLPLSNSTSNQPYYYHEDHISVAKFAPYTSMEFIDSSNNSTLTSKGLEYLSSHIVTTVTNYNSGTGVLTIQGVYDIASSTNPELKINDKVIIHKTDGVETQICTAVAASTLTIATGLSNIQVNDVVEIQRPNPDYDVNYKGDTNLLKDEFAKFSYRFKYDDNEYSLMAPFTQAAFVPKQFGYFKYDDETVASQSGDVKFMENRVDNIKLIIQLPDVGNKLERNLKIKELQIVVKNADEQAVRVIEDIPINVIASSIPSGTTYEYNYLSTKPIKTLPEVDLIRVHDKIPIRALTQELSGNRIIYGNYIDKHTSPDNLNYELAYAEKSYPAGSSPTDIANKRFTVEFPNHTVKQNRTYQVGIVLVDRYGRASNVILNDANNVGSTSKNSTIYAPYNNAANAVNFWGNYLILALTQDIPNTLSKEGYPGLYSETNPLGYYTYRIVVKQQEQDYYNVYTPGALAGELLWDVAGSSSGSALALDQALPSFHSENRITLLNLFGDNINKVPRELNTSNSNDTTFGSNVVLFNRVNPIYDSTDTDVLYSYNTQSNVSPTGENVVSIEPFKELGEWTTKKGNLYPDGNTSTPQPWYPCFESPSNKFNFHDVFFNAMANPFVARIETDFKIGATPVYNGGLTDNLKKLGIERAWQDLGVFETKPNTSVLDIYWETSTAGLITDLNSETGLDIPTGAKDTAGNNTATGSSLQYNHFESDASGTDITLSFELVNQIGNTLATTPSLTISSVVDGLSNNRTSEFTINTVSPGNFTIRTNSTFVFNEDAASRENYTFNLLASDTSGTPAYTNTPVQISNCRLQNVKPIWNKTFGNPLPTDPYQPSMLFGGFVVSITPNDVFNGSANISRRSEEIVYEILDDPNLISPNPGNGADDFEIQTDTPNYGIYAKNSAFVGSTYSLIVRATDANGNGLSLDSNSFLVKVNS